MNLIQFAQHLERNTPDTWMILTTSGMFPTTLIVVSAIFGAILVGMWLFTL